MLSIHLQKGNFFRKILLLTISAILFSFSCSKDAPQSPRNDTTQITILYTNDEHGWMENSENHSGADGLMAIWKENDGYSESGPFLILSGGDMWTGPAISTWFQGESMAEVFNALNYDAAAIGNHEFDFKIEGLKDRVEQSDFPFLSANIREKTSGAIPDFIEPYVIFQIDSIEIGVIGITTTSTPYTTFPDHVADYDFIPYETALRESVPQVKSEGADLLIVIGHICSDEMHRLVPLAKELDIALITGGHCRQLVSSVVEGVGLVKTSAYLEFYGKVEIQFDRKTNSVSEMEIDILPNITTSRDAGISAIIDYWKNRMDAALSKVIGYTNSGIERESPQMENLVMDSWLVSFPMADAAMSNAGGIRQSIPVGDITLETIVGLLPFENQIIELKMSGAEIQQWAGNFIHAGLRGNNPYTFADSTVIRNNEMYSVLTTDYLYSRDDRPFQSIDANPYNTSVNYRQPVIDWIQSLNTSSSDPLENYLDPKDRK
ncbi:MAG: bifunctional metallophosphatase/5'-nucleotidase [Calditrichaeota bacterium]|nr:MAG: bifunctional metallophosphatase/5'-nucleotidase [Calditrichota bacterium]